MIRKLNVKEMEGAEVQAADQLSGGLSTNHENLLLMWSAKNERCGSPHTGYSYGVIEC